MNCCCHILIYFHTKTSFSSLFRSHRNLNHFTLNFEISISLCPPFWIVVVLETQKMASFTSCYFLIVMVCGVIVGLAFIESASGYSTRSTRSVRSTRSTRSTRPPLKSRAHSPFNQSIFNFYCEEGEPVLANGYNFSNHPIYCGERPPCTKVSPGLLLEKKFGCPSSSSVWLTMLFFYFFLWENACQKEFTSFSNATKHPFAQ